MRVREILLLAEAVRDLEAGSAFYEQQQRGVGDYFWDSVIADIESLLIHGGVHQRAHGYLRMLAKRLPYSIYYEIAGKQARVIAIFLLRRDPAWLEDQLGDRNG